MVEKGVFIASNVTDVSLRPQKTASAFNRVGHGRPYKCQQSKLSNV